MGKKNKEIEYSLMPANSIDDVRIFHVLADSGDGYQHDYTIKALEVESGTLYSMQYSDHITWSSELRNVNIFHLLNTGDGYEWINTKPMRSTVQYDEFYLYSVFFRLIQDVESHDRFSTKILEIKELTKFNY
jgi:hypothetical protein